MTRSVEGFDPAFTQEVHEAMAAAGISSDRAVAARHMLESAGPSGDGNPRLYVLWEADEVWIGPAGGEEGCIGCFRLWRLHGWRRAAERPSADLAAPMLPPMGRTWIASLIASVAADSARPAPPLSGMRCASLATLSVSDHHYLPHPDCDYCSAPEPPPARAALLDDAPAPIEGYRAERPRRLRDEAMPLLVDRRCGLIRKLSRGGRTRFLPTTRAELHPFENPSLVEYGFGRSGRSGDDSVIAVLEALERYCGAPRNRPERVAGSYAQLQARAVDPESFILHAPEQREEPGFALAPYSPDTSYDWVWGHSVRRRGPVLVPMQIAFYDLGRGDRIRGGRFVQEVSNGCAVGSSRVEAALHGLFEAIERDAFLAGWYSRRPLRRVDAGGCEDPFVRALVARIEAEELGLEVLDLGSGIEAAAFAVRFTDPSNRLGPALAFAAGAHLDPAAAVRGALSEAVTMFGGHDEEVRATRRERAEVLLADPSKVRRMDDHTAQGWSADALGKRGFAVSAEPPLTWAEIAAPRRTHGPVDLAAAFARLAESALEHCEDVIVVDQSFPGLPVHCVKVLAPGLLPMTFGHQYRRVSKARLEKLVGPEPAPAVQTPHMFP